MSMFILAYFLGVDALHAACLQPACRASTPVCRASTPGCRASTPCTRRRRRECARVFQWRRLHLKRNAGCMQAACRASTPRNTPRMKMQPACRLHAGCMHAAATCNLLHTIVCRLHAGCMQPACSLHASLVGHWLKRHHFQYHSFHNIIHTRVTYKIGWK